MSKDVRQGPPTIAREHEQSVTVHRRPLPCALLAVILAVIPLLHGVPKLLSTSSSPTPNGPVCGEPDTTVPAPVLAEAWRGGPRQASLARLLVMCDVEPMSALQARTVGELAGRSGHPNVVDVTVVEGAHRRGDSVITSDPRDLQRIVDSIRLKLIIGAI